MAKIEMCAPCLFGLEGVLADELRNIEAEDVRPENGRVLFSGDSRILARANLWLRTAERVEIVVGSFKALSFEELFEGTKKLDWERWIDKKDAFPVKGWSLNSKLFSIPDCQSIIKKAVVKKLSEKYKVCINGYVAYYDKELELKVKYYNKKNNRNVTSDELKNEFEKFLESDASKSETLDDFHDTIKGNFSTEDCNHDLDSVTFEDFEVKINKKLNELYGLVYYGDATEEQINNAIDSITSWEDDDE